MTTYSFPTLSAGVSTNSTLTTNYRTNQMNFGDGYSQTAADGINWVVDTWTIKWENINLTDLTTLKNFFNTVGSYLPITWTSPLDSAAKLYKVDIQTGVQYQANAGNVFTVSTKLIQVF